MTLVVEDGSIVANANCYADLATIKAYATARGIALGTDTVIEQQVIKAIDYLEGLRNRFQGNKVVSTQCLQFPRQNVWIDGFEILETVIPNELVKAQCQLVCEQANSIDIMPTQSEPAVKKEVIGPIETEYAVATGTITTPVMTAVDALLEPLFKNNSGFTLTTVRV